MAIKVEAVLKKNGSSKEAILYTSNDFCIHFRRGDNYKGEYGFDWVDDHLKETSLDFEALEKEYEKTTLAGKEYFIPWLAIHPDHANKVGKEVTLNLEVESFCKIWVKQK